MDRFNRRFLLGCIGTVVALCVVTFILTGPLRERVRRTTLLRTQAIYEILRREGARSPALAALTTPTGLRQIQKADADFGRVREYRIAAVFAQVSGTPSGCKVFVTRQEGKTEEEIYVGAVWPDAMVTRLGVRISGP